MRNFSAFNSLAIFMSSLSSCIRFRFSTFRACLIISFSSSMGSKTHNDMVFALYILHFVPKMGCDSERLMTPFQRRSKIFQNSQNCNTDRRYCIFWLLRSSLTIFSTRTIAKIEVRSRKLINNFFLPFFYV